MTDIDQNSQINSNYSSNRFRIPVPNTREVFK